jgi:hypothetical protein
MLQDSKTVRRIVLKVSEIRKRDLGELQDPGAVPKNASLCLASYGVVWAG